MKRPIILLAAALVLAACSPANPPAGCKFHTRCANCMEKCKTEVPQQREIEPGHYVVCHLYDEA